MHNSDDLATHVYDTSGALLGELTFKDGYEVWPDGVNGWTHALDCRIEPYNERSLAKNIAFAKHVHKQAIVMFENRASNTAAEAAPEDDADEHDGDGEHHEGDEA